MQSQTSYVLSLDKEPVAVASSLFSATKDLERFAVDRFKPSISKILTFNYDLTTIKPSTENELETLLLRYGDEQNKSIEVIKVKFAYGWFSSVVSSTNTITNVMSVKDVPLNMYATLAHNIRTSHTPSSSLEKAFAILHQNGNSPHENVMAELRARLEHPQLKPVLLPPPWPSMPALVDANGDFVDDS